MLLSKIDVEDRLVNDLVSQVKNFQIFNGKVKVIYVKFDDATTGRNLMHSNVIRRINSSVPMQKIDFMFGLRKNRTHPMLNVRSFP